MMKRLLRALVCVGVAVASFSLAPVAHTVEAGTTEGCTPGYWKQKHHFDSWQEGADPTDALVDYYAEASRYTSTENMTLLAALKAKGGSGVEGAARILVRQAVAAWLNAAYDDEENGYLKYPWQRKDNDYRPPLIETVNKALASEKRAVMLKLAKQLDRDNNLGCPLN